MKKFFLSIMVFVISGCATTGNVPTEQEKDAAMSRITQCLKANIDSVDDGMSDAYTIAESLRSVCVTEFQDLTDIMTRGKTRRASDMIEVNSEDLYQRTTMTFVLRHRNANNK